MKIPKQTIKSSDLSKNLSSGKTALTYGEKNCIQNSIQSQKEVLLFSSALCILSELKLEREIKF